MYAHMDRSVKRTIILAPGADSAVDEGEGRRRRRSIVLRGKRGVRISIRLFAFPSPSHAPVENSPLPSSAPSLPLLTFSSRYGPIS